MGPLDYFVHDPLYGRWQIKKEIRECVSTKRELDLCNAKVYLDHRRYYTLKDAKDYLESLGSTIVKDIHDADIAIMEFDSWYSEKTQPLVVPDFLLHYKKVFNPYVFGRHVLSFKVHDTEKIELTEDVYRNICELLNSRDSTNQRMACSMLPTIKWNNNMFLLAALFGSHLYKIRELKLSQVPGFSKWASIRIPFWTRRDIEMSGIIPYMEDQNPETVKLIKYINKNA